MTTDIVWLRDEPAPLNQPAREAAEARQAILTKPPGALGRLEELAIWLAARQGSPLPSADRVRIVVFAADHGVADEGVSAFPQSVTAAMVSNFAQGGAAIGVLAHSLGAELEVLNLGTVEIMPPATGVLDCRLGPGTANFTQGPAMNEVQLAQALNHGCAAVDRAANEGIQIFIGGDMGIANTTVATALASVLLDAAPEGLAGPGTGLDDEGVRRKADVVRRALALHRGDAPPLLEILRRLGGFEIAALAGAAIRCAQRGLVMLVDGYIVTTAVLVAERLQPGVADWCLFAHASAEPGHARLLAALQAKPLLDLGLRLGEGSGAAVAVPLLRLACALQRDMATFAEAGVAGKQT